MSEKRNALLKALFVTFLWSTSWILIKNGLETIPPLFFAGTRYFLAFIILLIYYYARGYRSKLKSLNKQDWVMLIALGFVYIFLTQGLLILSLNQLPPVTTGMILNFSSLFIAVLGMIFLKEKLQPIQWGGIMIFLFGVAIYFNPIPISGINNLGIFFAASTVLANSFSAVLGRYINRLKRIDPLTVTVVSMGVGSILLLIVGLLVTPIPTLNTSQILMILWLSAVNTAFAFVVWNGTLQVLQAAESSKINNTMLVQIGILAWIFLGDVPSAKDWLGMIIATVGVMLVTWIKKSRLA